MSTQPSPLFLDAVRHHEAGNLGTAERLYRKLVEKEAATSLRPDDAARERGLYDEVIEGEIAETLGERGARYDLAVAADVLIYIGESSRVFAATRRALRPGGWFAFSVEVGERQGVTGLSSGRFSHSGPYIHDLAARSGFAVIAGRAFPLRKELDHHIEGRAYVLRAV